MGRVRTPPRMGKKYKEYLYYTLDLLATERSEFLPNKRMGLEKLLELYFSWADEYNAGYFPEMDCATKDEYCNWLTTEYQLWWEGG